MATPNAAELNALADNLASRYEAGTLQIRAGTTVLATHTLIGFSTASGGTITANAISDETISTTGTADNAKLIGGANEYDLTLGTSSADVIVSTTNYISGETSSINSLSITFA